MCACCKCESKPCACPGPDIPNQLCPLGGLHGTSFQNFLCVSSLRSTCILQVTHHFGTISQVGGRVEKTSQGRFHGSIRTRKLVPVLFLAGSHLAVLARAGDSLEASGQGFWNICRRSSCHGKAPQTTVFTILLLNVKVTYIHCKKQS